VRDREQVRYHDKEDLRGVSRSGLIILTERAKVIGHTASEEALRSLGSLGGSEFLPYIAAVHIGSGEFLRVFDPVVAVALYVRVPDELYLLDYTTLGRSLTY
jgi:hypothetical protein